MKKVRRITSLDYVNAPKMNIDGEIQVSNMRQVRLGDKIKIKDLKIGDLVRVIRSKSSYEKAQLYKIVKIYPDGFLGLTNIKVKSSYTFCDPEYVEKI